MSRTPAAVLEHRIGPDGLVSVTMRTGDLRIRAVDGDTVRVHVDDIDDRDGVRAETGDGRIDLQVRPNRPSDVTLEIPGGANLVVDGASVDLRAVGLQGVQRYRTASGDIKLEQVQGSLAVEAMSGDVDIIADGPVAITARTVSGEFGLRAGVVSGLQVTTTSGDLRLAGRFDGDGPFQVETVSGDATIAPAGDVMVEARTVTGDLRSDLPAQGESGRGRRTIVVGAGRPTLTFRSTSGDLRVLRAAPLPVPPRPPVAPPPPALPPPPIPAPSEDRTMADPTTPEVSTEAAADDRRLAILRDLETGEIDVAEAGRRLEELDVEEDDHVG